MSRLVRRVLLRLRASPVGQQTILSSQDFIVPDNVFFICAVCVAWGGPIQVVEDPFYKNFGGEGGAIRWVNNIAVTPGETLIAIITEHALQQGRTALRRGSIDLVAAGNGTEVGTGNFGGDQGGGGEWPYGQAGSGAGGWTQRGQNGQATNTGGGGAFRGGGVDLYGVVGFPLQNAGSNQSSNSGPLTDRRYGGGAGISNGSPGALNQAAQPGAMRIIWGDGRAFPNTQLADL